MGWVLRTKSNGRGLSGPARLSACLGCVAWYQGEEWLPVLVRFNPQRGLLFTFLGVESRSLLGRQPAFGCPEAGEAFVLLRGIIAGRASLLRACEEEWDVAGSPRQPVSGCPEAGEAFVLLRGMLAGRASLLTTGLSKGKSMCLHRRQKQDPECKRWARQSAKRDADARLHRRQGHARARVACAEFKTSARAALPATLDVPGS